MAIDLAVLTTCPRTCRPMSQLDGGSARCVPRESYSLLHVPRVGAQCPVTQWLRLASQRFSHDTDDDMDASALEAMDPSKLEQLERLLTELTPLVKAARAAQQVRRTEIVK